MMLSLVIPAYNETQALPALLENIHATVKTHGYVSEVIFINNGSTDTTTEVLDALSKQADLPIHVIHFKRNRCKAEALTQRRLSKSHRRHRYHHGR